MTVKIIPPSEGTALFTHPSLPEDKPCHTWYKIVGDLSNGKRPLVLLHGGPGAASDYFEIPFLDYPGKADGTPVVFYDQIGGAKSTHYREKRLDEEFWTFDLFFAEMENLLKHLGIFRDFDLLGHSWGGMMAAKYAASAQGKASGLNKLILASAPVTAALWTKSAVELLEGMPKNVRDAIIKYGDKGDFENPKYKEAIEVFYAKHICNLSPWPDCLNRGMAAMEEDDTVYRTINGPDEIHCIGSLKDFNMIEECKNIEVPTFLTNGGADICLDQCVTPWFKGIKKCVWYEFENGTHMAHMEYPEKFAQLVADFLAD